MINAYVIQLGIFICIYAVLAVSLNLSVGFAGMLNLGHIAFYAIGAYTSALLTNAGVPFPIAFLCAGIFAAIFAYLLVVATHKLRGDYLALATLGFSFVVGSVLLNWTSLTRGPLGIPGIHKPSIFGIPIATQWSFFILAAVVCAVTYWFIHRLTSSSYGTAVQAMRDDEIGVKVLGKNTFALKWQVLAVSAFFAGIAGSLFAHYITFIDPSSFNLTEIILVISIIILGGLVSLRGSFIGTVILILLPEALRFLDMPSSILGPMRQIIYCIIIIAILFWRPRGLLGEVDLA